MMGLPIYYIFPFYPLLVPCGWRNLFLVFPACLVLFSVVLRIAFVQISETVDASFTLKLFIFDALIMDTYVKERRERSECEHPFRQFNR